MIQFRNISASSSVVLCLLLSTTGDAASTLGRKRIALDTAFTRPKDSFGLERNLEFDFDFSFGNFGSMSSYMSMSMCMSMSMDMDMHMDTNTGMDMDTGMKGEIEMEEEKDKIIYKNTEGVILPPTNTLVSGTTDSGVVVETESTGGGTTGGTGSIEEGTTGGTKSAVGGTTGVTKGAGGDRSDGTDSTGESTTGVADSAGESTTGVADSAEESTTGSTESTNGGTTKNPSKGGAAATGVVSDSGTISGTPGSSGTTDSTVVITADSRSCSAESSSFTFEQSDEYYRIIKVPYLYQVETKNNPANRDLLKKIDSVVLDNLAQNLLACAGSNSERVLMAQRLLSGDLRVSSIKSYSGFDDETCDPTDKNSKYCAVAVGTVDLTVDDSSVNADVLTEATLSMIKNSMHPSDALSSSIEDVTKVTYVPIVHEVTIDAPAGSNEIDVSSGSDESDAGATDTSSGAGESDASSGADEYDVDVVRDRGHGDLGTFGADAEAKEDNNSSGSGGVIAGAVVAGACVAVLGGVLLARRRRRNASRSDDVMLGIEPRDLEQNGFEDADLSEGDVVMI